jgi:cellulose synthase operon protein C
MSPTAPPVSTADPRRRSGPALARVGGVLLLLTSACAGPRLAGKPGSAAREGLAALVEAGDPARAEARLAPAARRKDPWAHLGLALLARRALDGAGEVRHLLAAIEAAPDDPLALVALRRLAAVPDDGPARAAEVEAGLRPLLERGGLTGLAAYRARVARAAAAESTGDLAAAAARRGENGAVTAWTLAGPFAVLHAMDFDRPIPPEQGTIPAEVPAGGGLPPHRTRPLPAPDGTVALEGEPLDADVYALASDLSLALGGRYLLAIGTDLSVKVLLDGTAVHERRAFAGWSPGLVHVPLELSAGRHRLVVKLSRGAGRAGLHVGFARLDGAPSDATFAAPAAGSPPPTVAAAPTALTPDPAPLGARALAAALEPAAGPVLARFLAARDAAVHDREGAKALLAEALVLRPGAPELRIAEAELLAADPTLDDRVARGRAESSLRDALRTDPGHGEARVALAGLLRQAARPDDAEEVLEALAAPAATRPAALAARARAALDRSLPERAEALAREALRGAEPCEAAELAYELATRRAAIAREDEALAVLSRCRGGLERRAAHLRRRGDAAGAQAALAPLAAARPWAVETALARAADLFATGAPGRAAEVLQAATALWPRASRLQGALADALEAAGDLAGARAAREAALLGDPGDLAVRRALALEDGRELLQDVAVDGREAIRAYEAAGRPAGASSVMVLDFAAVELVPGGAAIERTHQITRVLDPQGVERLGEVQVPAGAEVLTLRTVKPDGRAHEPDRAAGGKGSVSLAGLAPGDYVELEYLRATRGARGSGGFQADPFFFEVAGTPLFRSTYVVRAPAGLGLELDAHQLDRPALAREGELDVLRLERTRIAPFQPEPDGPGLAEILPFVTAGTGGSREAVQRTIADALVERVKLTEELRALARGLRAEAGPGAGSLALARAAHARVARTVLGAGGGLHDEASAVLSRGRGSRVLVLKALLDALGVPARIALVRPFTAIAEELRFPAPALWHAPLLRVVAEGQEVWLDPATRLSPFGAFPAALADCEALLLPAPGEPLETARTPARSPGDADRAIEVEIRLAQDGSAEVSGVDRYPGAAGAELKEGFERLDASDRRQAVEGRLGRVFRGVAITDVAIDGEDDPAAPFVIRWRARVPDLARAANGGLTIEASLFPARLASRFVQLASRRTPLVLPMTDRLRTRLVIRPPPGLRPAAGTARELSSPFGRFERTERLEDGALVREEALELRRARIPPDRYPGFAAFAAGVDEIQDAPVILTR